MRQKSRWKSLLILVFILQIVYSIALDRGVIYSRNNAQKSPFSPRMDYNQWKPLGRGDPLKNDPTFDYVPPVLEHVHYWIDPEPSSQIDPNEDNRPKTEILLLGVSSKKPATNTRQNQPPVMANDRKDTIYEPYSKYFPENGPNHYNYHSNQRIARPNYFPPMTSQIIPSIMSLANKVFDRTAYFKDKESRIPYTVLMPPPIVTKILDDSIQYSELLLTTPIPLKPVSYEPFTSSERLPSKNQLFSSSTPPKQPSGVTVQESSLIYQSSSLGNQKEFESVPSISWKLSTTTEPNIKNSFHQKLSPPKSFMKIPFSPRNLTNKILEASDSNHNNNYVTPPSLNDDQLIFTGIVSDDNDLANIYGKIEKPEAEMDHIKMNIKNNHLHPVPVIFPYAQEFKASTNLSPMSMQTIRDMETMKPPPVTQSPVYTRPTTPSPLTKTPFVPISPTDSPAVTKAIKPYPVTESTVTFKTTNPVASILKTEHVMSELYSSNLIGSSSSITNTVVTTPKPDGSYIPISTLPTISSETDAMLLNLNNTSIIPPPSATTLMTTTTEVMTTMQTLTTDPLFKHYRQPAEPLRGPLYLIIQGHSKVKTYKPAKQIDGIMVQETNEIPYLKNRKIDYTIKHLHGFENKEDFLGQSKNIAKQRQARTGNLQTLKHVVQTGLGAIDFSREEQEILKKSDIDMQETDLEVGYEVVDSKDATSEKYFKGIVEEARKLKSLKK